ncbi:hypothetical protein HS088_TW11G00684 [Tripterygium wilfordii]|uniref:DUF7950 domain-containing protein n=1 Tax=Tripterygium wilfordii TaxID=458696 RepID=A0A7J7D2W6_TRIWF|nr:uncharacterized protein LOC120008456 [Tripterygium wilfordii]KAF5740608.1 hypothetical protein HS088_TW11G00684 [Tripterygium wilfordii]
MIKTLSPYSDAAKTAQIMSKYRPIAPKPEVPINESPPMSQKIRQSPYLGNLWPQLQARPTRTRKRGRAAVSLPTSKRQKAQMFSLSSPSFLASPAKNLCLQVFAHGLPQLTVTNPVVAGGSLDSPVTATTPSSLMALPLLPCPNVVPVVTTNQETAIEDNCMEPSTRERDIDLNTVAEIPEEKDLLQQLQGKPVIITPRPVRPVGSSISVGCIIEDPNSSTSAVQVLKKLEELEEEVESEVLPAIVSDSNNKVRVANSAYKKMVGQPECPWLDLMEPVAGDGHSGGHSCRRICGEVMLHLSNTRVPVSSNGFSCWVRIEWGQDEKKRSVNTFSDVVIRSSCESKDHLFTWRFHTPSTSREAPP